MTLDRKKKLESEGWQFEDVADFLEVPQDERTDYWEAAEEYGKQVGKTAEEVLKDDVDRALNLEIDEEEVLNKYRKTFGS